uniref:Uncharacterized protein n=1 Tax=Anguilla anguilla TaxID=7936 RepID=A0A0E9SUW5_ANGAN
MTALDASHRVIFETLLGEL